MVEDSMGGTSGGLYSIYLSALAQGVRDSGDKELTGGNFQKASNVALDALYKYTRARPGYRTLIDALQPFVEALKAGKGPRAAAQAAYDGAEKTRKMDALVGRASYVAKEELRKTRQRRWITRSRSSWSCCTTRWICYSCWVLELLVHTRSQT
ncbi:BPG_G0016960.mRNA.1.CDS.1 [Saccharomyces cerevisiae]|nr:BPG_G0016960.mRNA.1.CDS.1 [Saccharomyces cerevisiae]CAI7110093.1 BPG_G0016960.mRNA.1.CDS.1 [Saccharomyces cerevisiae]